MRTARKQTNFATSAALLAALAIGAGVLPNANATLVFDLETLVSGSSPGGSKPWLRATITQDTRSSVLITMEGLNLVVGSNFEAVKDWAFNLNPNISTDQLTVTESGRVGSFSKTPTIASLADPKGFAGFKLDFDFDFSTAGGNADTRFTQGDELTVRLTRKDGFLLSEKDFDYFASHDGQPDLYSAAHIISIATSPKSTSPKSPSTQTGEGSAYVGATTSDITPVPEPTTIVAGALLLLPFGASTIRILRKNRTA